MARNFKIAGIFIYVNLAACAHSCRYCSTGKKSVAGLPFGRLIRLVERFAHWRERHAARDFDIDVGIGHSHNYDVEVLVALEHLRERLSPDNHKPQAIYLGGLQLKDQEQLREWLVDRKDKAGVQEVHASLAGCGAVHDYWNRRKGDFHYLMRAMRTASEVGLSLRQRLFITRNTLACLDELLAELRSIPGPTKRYYNLFYYRGAATEFEHERITDSHRDALPEFVRLEDAGVLQWRSEREWIDVLKDNEVPAREIYLKLNVNANNIDRLDAMACDAIVDDIALRTQSAYAAIPARDVLIERHADRNGRLVYKDDEDIENKWLDLSLRESGIHIERHLTHLWHDFSR